MTRQTTAEDRALTAGQEGRVRFIYDDAYYPARKYVKGTTIKGNLTGGVGHLISRHEQIVDPAAFNAYMGKPVPDTIIDQWLDDDMNDAEAAVDTGITVPLSDHQFGALVDFTFNCGVGAFQSSGLRRAVNGKRWNDVPAEFQKWTKTTIKKNGAAIRVTSTGLIKRRAAEIAYFFGGKAPALPKTATIQPQATEIATPKAKNWSPTELVGAGGTVATVAGAGFTTEGFLSYVFGGILIVAVLVFGAIAVKRYFFRT